MCSIEMYLKTNFLLYVIEVYILETKYWKLESTLLKTQLYDIIVESQQTLTLSSFAPWNKHEQHMSFLCRVAYISPAATLDNTCSIWLAGEQSVIYVTVITALHTHALRLLFMKPLCRLLFLQNNNTMTVFTRKKRLNETHWF